jgi:hypothetical protein
MADQYTPAANVPAGGTDTSDAFGPTVTGSGLRPTVIPGFPTDVATGDQSYSPTAADVATITVPRAVFHDDQGRTVVHGEMTADSSNGPNITDHDGDDGLPDVPRYEGPLMGDTDSHNVLPAPMLNPSAGVQGPTENGMDDINPTGPLPTPGVGAPDRPQVVPDTTQDTYPRGDGASQGPVG